MTPEFKFSEFINGEFVESINGEIVYQKRLEDKMILLNHFSKTKIGVDLTTTLRTENAEIVLSNPIWYNGKTYTKMQDKIVVCIEKKTNDVSDKIESIRCLCNSLGIDYYIFDWTFSFNPRLNVTSNTQDTDKNLVEVCSIPVKIYLKEYSIKQSLKKSIKLNSLPQSIKNICWFDKLMQVFN